MQRRVFWSLFAFFILYNLGTLLFSAWNEGYVHDEPMYVEIGKMVLNGQRPEAGWGHPPLSIWTGTWLPWKLGHTNDFHPITLFLARLSHVFINSVGGLLIAFIILRNRGEFAALLFLCLFSTLGVLKFVSSHHLTDSDSTILAALSLVWLWAYPVKKPLQAFGPLLLFVLSTMSKISMILVGPFVGLPILWNIKGAGSKIKTAIPLFLTVLIALCITYRFHGRDFSQYFEIVKIQFGRSGGGAPNSLLGQRIDSGAWYYYFVVFFLKTPLLFSGLFLFSLVQALRRKTELRDAFFFLLPAVFIFVVFSQSTLQLGFRYIALSVLLSCIFISLSLDKLPKRKEVLLAGIALVLLSTDLSSLAKKSYQTYFNFLAPRPPVYFSDSNIDWHQKIPRHLEPLAPVAQPAANYLDFLLDPTKETETFQIASMELNNIWRHPAGVLFRGLEPFLTIAGHEFHRASKEEIYQLLEERPPFHSAGTQSFASWDVPLMGKHHCNSNQHFSIRSSPLLDLQKILRDITDSELKVEKKVSVSFDHLGSSLVVVESDGPIDLKIGASSGTFPRGSLEEYRHFSYWFPVQVKKKKGTATLQIEKRNKFPNRDINARALLLWYECLTP